jgi:2,4-diketo-3-deoxy-L-fuconate hydrolase
MKIANYDGRAHLVVDGAGIDVEVASNGRWTGSPMALFEDWEAFRRWADTVESDAASPLEPTLMRAPSPMPRQVFAIGLNYAAHAAEGGMEPPKTPPTFTKYLSSLAGPYDDVVLPAATVDWEAELVVVLGATATCVAENDAWGHIAGLTIGQDLSDRVVQLQPPVPQFSLGKSFPGFGPTGPYVVTPDEFDDPDDVRLGCTLNGELMQETRTSDMIFSVPRLIAHLSAVVTLYPGDLIFTGTPAGVGMGRRPPRFLQPGDELTTFVDGIGEMRNRLVAAADATVAVGALP